MPVGVTSSMLILSGLPASGKSTFAHQWVAEAPTERVRVNYDDLRLELYGPDWKFNRLQEAAMKVYASERADDALSEGKSVVVDNTNLHEGSKKPWLALAHKFGIYPEERTFSTSVHECVQRDRRRTGKARVGRAVIERMALFNGLIDWGRHRFSDGRPDIVLCDIDGTVADLQHRRSFVSITPHESWCKEVYDKDNYGKCPACGAQAKKDWKNFLDPDNVRKDTIIGPVAQAVRVFNWAGYQIVMVSGRGLELGRVTEEWLDQPDVPFLYRHLFMRNSGDSRPDYIVKGEIADRLPLERVAWVLDDRQQVVDMWRARGLTCLQVAPGDF